MLPPGYVTFKKKKSEVFWKKTDGDSGKKNKIIFSEEKSLSLYRLCCWWCGPTVEGSHTIAGVTQKKSPWPSRTRHRGSARTSHRTPRQSRTQWLSDIIEDESRRLFNLDSHKHPSYGIWLRLLRGDNVGWSRTLGFPRWTRRRCRQTRSRGTAKEGVRWYLSERL